MRFICLRQVSFHLKAAPSPVSSEVAALLFLGGGVQARVRSWQWCDLSAVLATSKLSAQESVYQRPGAGPLISMSSFLPSET